MSPSQTKIACRAETGSSNSLGDRAFNSSSLGIEVLERFRFLLFSGFLLGFIKFLWIEGHHASSCFGSRTMDTDWTRLAVFLVKEKRNIRGSTYGLAGIAVNTGLSVGA